MVYWIVVDVFVHGSITCGDTEMLVILSGSSVTCRSYVLWLPAVSRTVSRYVYWPEGTCTIGSTARVPFATGVFEVAMVVNEVWPRARVQYDRLMSVAVP